MYARPMRVDRAKLSGRNICPETGAAVWTAAEFYAAMMPNWFSRQPDPATVLGPMTKAAHMIALKQGVTWNTKGQYSIDVWGELYRID